MRAESPEQIDERMKRRREDLASKVDALHDEVGGAVHDTTDAIRDSAHAIRHAVTGTSEIVQRQLVALEKGASEGIRRVLNVGEAARERPWTAVGCAGTAGLVVGLFAFGKERTPRPRPAAIAGVPREPSLFDHLFAKLQTEIRRIGETAIDTASRTVRDAIQENVPKLVDAAASRLGDLEALHHQNGSHKAYAR